MFWSGGFCDCSREGPNNRQTVFREGPRSRDISQTRSAEKPGRPALHHRSVSQRPCHQDPCESCWRESQAQQTGGSSSAPPRGSEPPARTVHREATIVGGRPGQFGPSGPGVRNPKPRRFNVDRPVSVVGPADSARRAQGVRNPQPRRFIVNRPMMGVQFLDPPTVAVQAEPSLLGVQVCLPPTRFPEKASMMGVRCRKT